MMGEHGHPELPEVVLALRPPARFPRRLHGRQQQPDKDADNRDDHQEFHQGETAGAAESWAAGYPSHLWP